MSPGLRGGTSALPRPGRACIAVDRAGKQLGRVAAVGAQTGDDSRVPPLTVRNRPHERSAALRAVNALRARYHDGGVGHRRDLHRRERGDILERRLRDILVEKDGRAFPADPRIVVACAASGADARSDPMASAAVRPLTHRILDRRVAAERATKRR